MHVDEHLRVLLHDAGKVGKRAAGALEHGQQLQSRHQAVTGGVVLQEDDVAGLLAADDGAVREHALQNVAIAHGGLNHLEALLLHGDGEAQVAHDGRDDLGVGELATGGQVGAADGQDVVTVDLVALAVHEQHAVGVAVVGQTDVGMGAQHELAQGLEVSGAALDVDVGAAVIGVDSVHRGAQALQRGGRGLARSTVTAVDGNDQTIEPQAIKRIDGMIDICLASVLHLDDVAHAGTGRQRVGSHGFLGHDPGADLFLDRIGKLHTLAAKEFDAVELRRIMRSRDDDAAVELVLNGEQRHGRRGDDAAAVRTAALGHNAGGQSALEHGARKTRVAADADIRTKELGRRAAQAKRKVAREVGIGDATDAIGTEDVLGHRIAPSLAGDMQPPTLVEKEKRDPPRNRQAPLVHCISKGDKTLALGELGSAAGLLEAVLLALDHASIARKETGLLEVSTVVASVQKSAGDAQAQSAGLTGDAAAIAQSDNVELTGGVGHLEGSKGVLNELMTAEILLGVTLVDGHLAGAGDETDAGDGVLTTAGTLVDNGVLSHL